MTINDEQLTQAIRHAFDRYELAVPVSDVMTDRIGPRRRWRLVAMSSVVATAALVMAIVTQPLARPQAAFASWSAVPGVPDPALAAIAEEECRVVPPRRYAFARAPSIGRTRSFR